MYAEYAKDPRMKLNLGIRRRLAPLLDGGRDEIELMHAILFSLPGSPVLYYGDEIGMGDNVYLGDRDGVRTPMQWTGDRNGGFSRADFAQLYLPPLMDPVFGYQAVNVEAQLRTPTSLLRWLRRFIELRKQHPVFGSATTSALRPENPRIFAHVRSFSEATSCSASTTSRARRRRSSSTSPRSTGAPGRAARQHAFPRIGELPYLLTLGPRGFFWFQLTATRQTSGGCVSAELDRIEQATSLPGRARPARDDRLAALVRRQVARRARRAGARRGVVAGRAADARLRDRRGPLRPRGRTTSTTCARVPAAERRLERPRHRRDGGLDVYDAIVDPGSSRELVELMRSGTTLDLERPASCSAAPTASRRRESSGPADGRRAVEQLGRARRAPSCSSSTGGSSRARTPSSRCSAS